MAKSTLAQLLGQARGYEQGFNERADVLTQSADGTNLDEIWGEIQKTLSMWNSQRNTLLNQFTFRVNGAIENVAVPGDVEFEEASEYGQPVAGKGGAHFNRGYSFKFYDLAYRYTWMFLAEATQNQIRNLANMAMEADNRLFFNAVMKTMFNPSNIAGIADQNIPVTVYKFYNGDGEVPPKYKNNTFDGTHTHYSTSLNLGGASGALDPEVLDALEDDMVKHGYKSDSGTRLLLMVNRQEGSTMRSWKVATGAKYDFIPGQNYGGGVILPASMGIIAQPSGTVPGEIGTYGPFHIVEEEYVPAGYMVLLVSGGPDNLNNPIAIREHQNPAYRGLKLIPGARSDYPLTDSFYRRGFGTGVRQRAAGFVVQVVNSATYTVPSEYA